MPATTAFSAEEYLRTSFPDTDREYRDGKLIKRAVPDFLHGSAQGRLGCVFGSVRKKLSLFPALSTRMKLREGLYLIADVSVFWPAEPGVIPDFPPLIAVEILSTDDRFVAVRAKLQEYRTWGVPHVWLVDPHSRRLYTCDAGLVEVDSFSVPELNLTLGPADMFDEV